MRFIWREKSGEEGSMSLDGPMKVQQLGPPRDSRVDALNLAFALALANYRAAAASSDYTHTFALPDIMLDAEKILIFLLDDRVPEPVDD